MSFVLTPEVRRMVYNVLDYGATGGGSVSDSTAIQATINAAQTAGGGIVFFPAGTYNLSATLQVTQPGIHLMGTGWNSILYAQSGLNTDMLNVAPASGSLAGFKMSDLFLNGNQSGQTAGHGIHLKSVYNARLDHVWVRYAHDSGLYLDQVAGQAYTAYGVVTNSLFTDGYQPGSRGVTCATGSELNYFFGCNFDWHSGSAGVGIWIDSGHNMFVGCQADANAYNLYINSNVRNTFNNVLFDRSYYREVFLTGGTADNRFTDCQFGHYVDLYTLNGALSGTVTNIPLHQPLTQNIPTWGVPVVIDYGNGSADTFTVTSTGATAGAVNIPVNSRTASFSHLDAAPVVLRYRGVDIEGGAINNLFEGCIFSTDQNLNPNIAWQYVVGEDGGTHSQYTGCQFTGGPLSLQAASSVRYSSINPVGHVGPPSIPTSGSAYTNPYSYDCMVYLVGGTVSAVAVSGSSTGLTSGSFFVPAGATITLTYSAAPSWVWMAL